jgi:hypothetical protein
MFDERGVQPVTNYEKEQWREIATHNEKEIRGFFGDYRFLSNFWPAKVFFDGEEYATTENAYQAAKYLKTQRAYFKTCTPKEAAKYTRTNPMNAYTPAEWSEMKFAVMHDLLVQKFDPVLNPENHEKLRSTGSRYLEEANYWEDKYWGVHKTDAGESGEGENNLGKLLMKIRVDLFTKE